MGARMRILADDFATAATPLIEPPELGASSPASSSRGDYCADPPRRRRAATRATNGTAIAHAHEADPPAPAGAAVQPPLSLAPRAFASACPPDAPETPASAPPSPLPIPDVDGVCAIADTAVKNHPACGIHCSIHRHSSPLS